MKYLIASLFALLAVSFARAQDQTNNANTNTILTADPQLAVLLKRVERATNGTGPTPPTVTPTITTASTSGTVAAGSRGLTFVFSSTFTGTVLGATCAGATDSSLSIPAPPGTTLAAVAYIVSAGSVRILDVR